MAGADRHARAYRTYSDADTNLISERRRAQREGRNSNH
jgi:hypothetical protein